MMNSLDIRKRLPATEALECSIATQMIPEREIRKAAKLVTPQSSNDSLECGTTATATKRKRSFDMADLLSATEPVEQAIAFPTIEWCNDGESHNDGDDEGDVTESTPNKSLITTQEHHHHHDFDHDEIQDYFPSYSSDTSGLAKRSRFGYSRLGRSKSLKTSLCSLACTSIQDDKPGGSWPRMERQHKRQKSSSATQQQDLQQMNVNILFPLVATS